MGRTIGIRRYREGDAPELWALYHDTTHLVNGRDYTPEQCERWAPSRCDAERWNTRLATTVPFIAESEGLIVGFAELEPNGEIGYFYCHHAWQRQGVGSLLCTALEQDALARGLSTLRAEVSLTALPFFLRMGFQILIEQNKMICGAPAPNYVMEKALSHAGLR